MQEWIRISSSRVFHHQVTDRRNAHKTKTKKVIVFIRGSLRIYCPQWRWKFSALRNVGRERWCGATSLWVPPTMLSINSTNQPQKWWQWAQSNQMESCLLSEMILLLMALDNQSAAAAAEEIAPSPNNGSDDYDYDLDLSFDTYDWAELIPPVIVYSIILLTGTLGNGKFDANLISKRFTSFKSYFHQRSSSSPSPDTADWRPSPTFSWRVYHRPICYWWPSAFQWTWVTRK